MAVWFGLKVFAAVDNKEDFNYLNGCSTLISRVFDFKSESLVSAALEETGQIGFDHVLQLDPVESVSRMDIINLLAPHGVWVTGEAVQLDPPETKLLLRKGASVAFSFEPLWLLAPTQQGRFLHVLNKVMELAAKGSIKKPTINIYPLERARLAVRQVTETKAKLVLKI